MSPDTKFSHDPSYSPCTFDSLKNIKKILPIFGRSNLTTSAKNISKIVENPELSSIKTGPNFYKKGVHSDICFSSMVTHVHNIEDFIVYEHVLDKNLL
jgi:hypothetical protein